MLAMAHEEILWWRRWAKRGILPPWLSLACSWNPKNAGHSIIHGHQLTETFLTQPFSSAPFLELPRFALLSLFSVLRFPVLLAPSFLFPYTPTYTSTRINYTHGQFDPPRFDLALLKPLHKTHFLVTSKIVTETLLHSPDAPRHQYCLRWP